MTNIPERHRVSRYIVNKKDFSSEHGVVKANAFIAAPHQEHSVGCTQDMQEAEVWDLGDDFLKARPDGKKPIGRADISVSSILSHSMHVWRDDIPKFHANITGWEGTTRETQRAQALNLASSSSLVLKAVSS